MPRAHQPNTADHQKHSSLRQAEWNKRCMDFFTQPCRTSLGWGVSVPSQMGSILLEYGVKTVKLDWNYEWDWRTLLFIILGGQTCVDSEAKLFLLLRGYGTFASFATSATWTNDDFANWISKWEIPSFRHRQRCTKVLFYCCCQGQRLLLRLYLAPSPHETQNKCVKSEIELPNTNNEITRVHTQHSRRHACVSLQSEWVHTKKMTNRDGPQLPEECT